MNNERKDDGSVYSVGSQNNLVPIRSKQAYFKKRLQIPNLLVIILFVLVCSLLITVLVLAILYACSGTMKICDSEDCVRIAASLKESMNVSVDPCDDFYEYACGRWPQEHPIPDLFPNSNSWFHERMFGVIRKIRDQLKVNMSASETPVAVMQAKILFTSCMDVHAINELELSPLFDLLELLHFPIIPAFFTNQTTNYVEQLARVKRILNRDIFFGLDVVPDPKNNSRNVIVLDYAENYNSFPINKDLEKRLQKFRSRLRKLEDIDDEELDEDEEAELIYMAGVIKEVVNNGTIDECSSDDESRVSTQELEIFVQTLYNISTNFYHNMLYAFQNHSISIEDINDDNYMLVDDLQKLTDEHVISMNLSLTPKPFWRPLIELLFEEIVTLDLDNKDKVLVVDVDYLKNVAALLAALEDTDVESYIWWVIVDMMVPFSSEKLQKIWTDYIIKITDVEINQVPPRSLHCAFVVNEMMGMATSWLFVDPKFHNNEAHKVLEMIEDIKEAFVSFVTKTDWMDQSTKKATLDKSRKMESEIGFPKWLFDGKKLDKYYKGVDLLETKFLQNMVQLVRIDASEIWASLHNDNYNKTYWPMDPIEVNAFHSFQLNQITIPAGILQFPFYKLGLEALNYGAIGSILGHELTHGFDDSGRLYDSNGNLRQWWANESIWEYNERTECFINHYNTYYEDEVDDYINGELTLGENIADNGGLHEAIVAYKRWKSRHGREPLLPGFTQFTHEQLLFLAFAHLWCESYDSKSLKWMMEDSHCPGHVRLQAVLRNSEEFSKAWNCPVGSNMNPAKKCHLW